jgi:hypothetical protein
VGKEGLLVKGLVDSRLESCWSIFAIPYKLSL